MVGAVAGPLPTASWDLVLVSAVPLPLLRPPDSVPLQKGPPHTDPLMWITHRRNLLRRACGPWLVPRSARAHTGRHRDVACVPSASALSESGSRKGEDALPALGAAGSAERLQTAGVCSQLRGWRCCWQWQCGTSGEAPGPTETKGHTWARGSAAGGRRSLDPGGRWWNACPEREAPGPLSAPDPGPAPRCVLR